MICPPGKPFCVRSLWLMAASWFLVALFIGETELLSVLPGPAAPATVLLLTAALLCLFGMSRSLRTWVEGLDLRVLLVVHLTRFVGIYFLMLGHSGELPPAFAVPAGWGDIVAAAGALLLIFLSADRAAGPVLLLWNAFGLLDILFVVATAARFALTNYQSMHALTRLPLSFLPTMVVPLVIVTHLVIFMRVLKKDPLSVLPASTPAS